MHDTMPPPMPSASRSISNGRRVTDVFVTFARSGAGNHAPEGVGRPSYAAPRACADSASERYVISVRRSETWRERPLYSARSAAAPVRTSPHPARHPPRVARWSRTNFVTASAAYSCSPHMNTRSFGTKTSSKITRLSEDPARTFPMSNPPSSFRSSPVWRFTTWTTPSASIGTAKATAWSRSSSEKLVPGWTMISWLPTAPPIIAFAPRTTMPALDSSTTRTYTSLSGWCFGFSARLPFGSVRAPAHVRSFPRTRATYRWRRLWYSVPWRASISYVTCHSAFRASHPQQRLAVHTPVRWQINRAARTRSTRASREEWMEQYALYGGPPFSRLVRRPLYRSSRARS